MVARFTCKEEREQRKRERTEKERERERSRGGGEEREERACDHIARLPVPRSGHQETWQRERERQQPLVRSEATYKH